MNELVYITIWLVASALFIIQAIFKKSGIMSATFTLGLFVILFYGSTNIESATNGVFVSNPNPLVQWMALFGAVLSTLILFLALFGIWKDREGDETAATDSPDVDRVIG